MAYSNASIFSHLPLEQTKNISISGVTVAATATALKFDPTYLKDAPMTPITEMTDFLDIAVKQGFLNDNTVAARRTAVNKFAEIIDVENRTVEYLHDNLDVVKTRFSNLNKEVRGNTVDEYAR